MNIPLLDFSKLKVPAEKRRKHSIADKSLDIGLKHKSSTGKDEDSWRKYQKQYHKHR